MNKPYCFFAALERQIQNEGDVYILSLEKLVNNKHRIFKAVEIQEKAIFSETERNFAVYKFS